MESSAAQNAPGKRPLLRVRDLGFQRDGRWLFRNLSFDLHRGEFMAVVGPSGVGKTTLLSCLCGARKPSEGVVEYAIDDKRDQGPAELRKHFGIIFQSLQLTPNANLMTNVLCGRLAQYSCLRTLFGFPRKLRAEAYGLLQELGVAADTNKWVSEMSGGEQQRVAMARALFQRPTLYFADEPVSSLDSYYAGRVLGLLRQEADERKRAVLCVLHNAEHIQRFADAALSIDPQSPTSCRIRRVRPNKTTEAGQ